MRLPACLLAKSAEVTLYIEDSGGFVALAAALPARRDYRPERPFAGRVSIPAEQRRLCAAYARL
jgi:hypothetical protein